MGFPDGAVVKNQPINAGDTEDTVSISGLGRSLGGGNGNPLQYSCPENPMNRSLAGYSPQYLKESDMIERLSSSSSKTKQKELIIE